MIEVFKKKINNLLVGLANKCKDRFGIYLSLVCDVYLTSLNHAAPSLIPVSVG